MPEGKYIENSNYYVGVLPDGTVKWYCQEMDYKEEFAEMESTQANSE